ncbi:MAG: hypothetical protein WD097_03380 [Balneolales bacterium]
MKPTSFLSFTRKYFHPILIIFTLFVAIPCEKIYGQLRITENYEVGAAPDLWFNAVDGVRTGVRFRGEEPGTFLDGRHRIDAGIWLGTRFPENPLSYYFSYTHPVDPVSDANSEGAFRMVSSIRAGLHLHESGFQKRWQPGFDEYISFDLGIFAGLYHRFDMEYVLYEKLWQQNPMFYLRSNFRKRDRNIMGRWTVAWSVRAGFPLSRKDDFTSFSDQKTRLPRSLGIDGLFAQVHLEAMQEISLPMLMVLRARLFGGISSDALPSEFRYLTSDAVAMDWIHSGFTRARGTLPQHWMGAGWIHIPGGPNLRGYTLETTELLEKGLNAWSQHVVSYNLNLYYPNPFNIYISKIPYLGEMLKLESYVFSDAGFLYRENHWQRLRINAGAGFMLSLNIPDYLGKDRGFFIRYELPVWLSEVSDGENNLKARHVLGIGALFRL